MSSEPFQRVYYDDGSFTSVAADGNLRHYNANGSIRSTMPYKRVTDGITEILIIIDGVEIVLATIW